VSDAATLISFHILLSTTAPNFDRSQWLSEKFNLGLDFPNVSAGKGRFGEDVVISPHLLAWLRV
jgi:hypothetical protein